MKGLRKLQNYQNKLNEFNRWKRSAAPEDIEYQEIEIGRHLSLHFFIFSPAAISIPHDLSILHNIYPWKMYRVKKSIFFSLNREGIKGKKGKYKKNDLSGK